METPNPPNQPNPDKVIDPYGRHPLDEFIHQDRTTLRNTTYIKNTQLLATFQDTRQYMEELHKRVITEVQEKFRWNQKLARTMHTQLAAVVKRYLPIIEEKFNEWYPPFDTSMEVTGPDPQTGEDRTDYLDVFYRPITAEQHEGEMERERLRVWQEAVQQAEQIEQRCKELADKYNQDQQRGNIEFVKKLDRGGKTFTKRSA